MVFVDRTIAISCTADGFLRRALRRSANRCIVPVSHFQRWPRAQCLVWSLHFLYGRKKEAAI